MITPAPTAASYLHLVGAVISSEKKITGHRKSTLFFY